jgi:hypothetical protein
LTVRARAIDTVARLSVAAASHAGPLGAGRVELQPGTWTDAAFDLSAAPAVGEELDLRLTATGPVAVSRVALA